MVIGVLHIELRIDEAESLKDKRVVLNRLREKVRNKFNVSFAEVDMQDIRNGAGIAVVTASNDQRHADQTLSKVKEFIEASRGCDVEDVATEFL